MKQLDSNNLDELFGCIEGTETREEKVQKNSNELTTINKSGEIEVNTQHLYEELASLIETGKIALDSANYILSSSGDAESISGVAQMMGSLRSVISEFNKINLLNIKFSQQKELENLRFNNRLKLIEKKNSDNSDNIEEDLVAFNTEDIIQSVLNAQNN